MENLESKILEVLQDPQQMDQILQIAKSFGFGSQEDSAARESSAPDPSMIIELLNATCSEEPRREALLQALLPYLKPERQKKLQRAVKLAKLSTLAGFAMHSFNE